MEGCLQTNQHINKQTDISENNLLGGGNKQSAVNQQKLQNSHKMHVRISF